MVSFLFLRGGRTGIWFRSEVGFPIKQAKEEDLTKF